MCELLGMSANVPTDICFSFTGLVQRGGRTGPHRDGWGIAFYEDHGLREFREPMASCESAIARLLQEHPIKSRTVIAHVRQANVGQVNLANTHPFTREVGGRYFSFAHNGQLTEFRAEPGRYTPVGTTDSEAAFCTLLNRVVASYPRAPAFPEIVPALVDAAAGFTRQGVFNCLLSDGEYLFAFCSTKLAWLTRRAPFGAAVLADCEVRVDFAEHTGPKDVVSVIATEPLTVNEDWQRFAPGEWRLFRLGEPVASGRVVLEAAA